MPFDVVVPILMIIGAFYAFAGFVAVRAVLSARLIDIAIAAIAMQRPSRREALQQIWLLVASLLILAGGLALLLRLELAAALFVAGAVLQGVYLLIAAPYYFDREEPPEAGGRGRTANAAVLYIAATAFVVWAYAQGYLFTLQQVPPLLVAIAATAVIAYGVYAAWNFASGLKSSHRASVTADEADADET